jgi:hypothetical protein
MKIKFLLFIVSLTGLTSGHSQTAAQFADLINQVKILQAQVLALQRSPVQALTPFLTVDSNPKNGVRGPNVIFHDCNLHLTNGTFDTTVSNGLGNLIIGYNELPNPNIVQAGERGGSHNLVMGRWNKFFNTSFGSFVGGQWNDMHGFECAIISGYRNNVTTAHSVVVGGSQNSCSNGESVVVGGYFNGTGGVRSVQVGGQNDHLGGNYSVGLGGKNQDLIGDYQVSP